MMADPALNKFRIFFADIQSIISFKLVSSWLKSSQNQIDDIEICS